MTFFLPVDPAVLAPASLFVKDSVLLYELRTRRHGSTIITKGTLKKSQDLIKLGLKIVSAKNKNSPEELFLRQTAKSTVHVDHYLDLILANPIVLSSIPKKMQKMNRATFICINSRHEL